MKKANSQKRIIAIVVTYGKRWHYLEQVIAAILRDDHVSRLILVENASQDDDKIQDGVKKYGNRVKIIRHEKNLGSAGGFTAGIVAARQEDADYVYLSDDDMVIEDDFANKFFASHTVIANGQVVLASRRKSYWAGTDVHYSPETVVRPRVYFNIFNPRILKVFISTLLGFKSKKVSRENRFFFPIIPSQGWAYGGVLLPMSVVREAPLPDTTLMLYLDDIVYSWGIVDAGVPCFAVYTPSLEDLELTHSGQHTTTGLYDPNISTTKIYYETRNRVRVSLGYGRASRGLLAIRVFIWGVGVCALGLVRAGLSHHYGERTKLIVEALRAGFDVSRSVPESVQVRA